MTHVDLLLERPVELPFLNVRLPMKAFFIIAPFLFLVSHAYTMAHFALLADKAKRFHLQLKKKIDGACEKTHDIREGIRLQLPINLFVQFLAGPEDIREGPFSILLWATAWATVVACRRSTLPRTSTRIKTDLKTKLKVGYFGKSHCEARWSLSDAYRPRGPIDYLIGIRCGAPGNGPGRPF